MVSPICSNQEKPQFAFWLIIMAAMFFASVWFTYRTVATYNETPTVTNVATIPNSTLNLPDVLICYSGGLNASAMKEANLSDNLIVTFHKGFAGAHHIFDKPGFKSAYQELNEYMERTNYGIKDIVRKFSFDCDDIVMNFSNSNDKIIYFNQKCDHAETIVTPSGNCYAFNTNNGYQWYPGKAGGLTIKLKSPKTSFSALYYTEASEINLDGDFVLTMEKNLGSEQTKRSTTIPINSKTQIILRPNLYKRTSKKTNCETANYSSTNVCFNDCYIGVSVDKCGCMPTDYWYGNADNDGTLACNPLNNNCIGPMDLILQCQENCQPMCTEWIFKTTISYGPMIEEDNASKVFIFYNTMQYDEIEIIDAFTLDMAIANVGGQSGLWLGCSIITIIQAVYFATLACVNGCRRKIPLKKNDQVFAAATTVKIPNTMANINTKYQSEN